MKDNIVFRPIGIIHSEFKSKVDVPIQPKFSESKGSVEIFPEYEDGLKDLEGFSHIILIFHFHKSEDFELLQKPFLDEKKRGVFSTRSPKRPNPIGISTVKLLRIKGNIIYVEGLDILDNTPILDIKPHIKGFEGETKSGWIEGKIDKKHKSDGRFGK